MALWLVRAGENSDCDEVITAVAHQLGFARVTGSVQAPIKSAIIAAIRQGVLSCQGRDIWRHG